MIITQSNTNSASISGNNTVTHTFATNWSNGGLSIAITSQITDVNEQNVTIVTNNGDTDINQPFALDINKTTALFIISSQTVTIRTNSYGSPAQTLTITGGVPFMWIAGSGIPFPITTNITSLHVNNASGAQATTQIKTLFHP